EADERCAAAHIDVEFGGLRQRHAYGRGDAGARRDRVALAVLEALDADLALIDAERRAVLAADRDKRRQIGAPSRQVFGELEAGARRSGVGIDRIVEQPETVILAHALVLQPPLRDLTQLERNAHGVWPRQPELPIPIPPPAH